MPPIRPSLDYSRVKIGSAIRQEAISVCHVISGHVWAGAQVQVATLLRALSTCSDLKLHSIVLEDGRLAQELRDCGVRVKSVPQYGASLVRILPQLAKFLGDQPVHIIHAHGYKENILAVILSKWCGIPVQVRTFHGARTPFSGFQPRHRAALFLDRLTTKYFVDHNVIVINGLSSSMIQEFDRAKVSVIHNGIDVQTIYSTFSVTEAKRRLQIPENALVIGAAA